jgi:hypothetical protein
MFPVDADELFTQSELVRLEARIRTGLITTRPATPEAVRQTARDALRLLREVQRARRLVSHLVGLAEEQGLLVPTASEQRRRA